jgi:hypothetical protein
MEIPEADWRILRSIKDAALERFCARALRDAAEVIADRSVGSHESYLRLFRLMEERDEELAGAFNDLRRSQALLQLAVMRRLGVVTDDEMARFSDETRERVARIMAPI